LKLLEREVEACRCGLGHLGGLGGSDVGLVRLAMSGGGRWSSEECG